MKFRERRDEERAETPRGAASGAPGSGLDALGNDSQRMLATSDAVVDRALSTNSEKFNDSSRQAGGQ